MYKIIIVDDERGASWGIERSIIHNCKDFEVVGSFLNGQEALSFLYSNSVDVVITDIRMPVMDGLELAKRIDMLGFKCKVIVLSGFGEFEYAQKAIDYNVWSYILKPVNSVMIKETLEKLKKELVDDEESDYAQISFFADLFTGAYSDEDEMSAAFKEARFPFKIESSKGVLAEVIIHNYEEFNDKHWDFEAQQMKNVMYNIAGPVLKNINIINQSANQSKIVFITDNKNLCSDIENGMNSVLPLEITITPILEFDKFGDIDSSKTMELMLDCIEPSYDDKSDITNRITAFIEENYNRNLSRNEVAEHVFLNETYIGRIFKRDTGKTIREYHLECRMKHAERMLEADEKVNVISNELGYKDKRIFLRQFKAYAGCSPFEYKKKIQSGTE